MKKTLTKMLLLALAAVMLLGTLSACHTEKKPTPEEHTTDPNSQNTDSKLPDKYWNRDFDIAGYSIEDGYTAGLWVEAPGDTVSTLIYARNMEVEEKYGITPTYQTYSLKSGAELDIVDLVRKDFMTGKTKFELISANLGEVRALAISDESYLMNFNDSTQLPYLDLTNSCWDQSSLEQLSVNNRLYMLTGDLNLTEKMNMGLLMYNRVYLSNMMGMDAETELLDMVRSGAWTLSEMSMMVKDAAKIDSGTGKVTGYGLDVRNNRSFFYYIAGCDVKIAVKNENDIPELMFNNEKTLNVVDKLLEFCSLKHHNDQDGVCYYARYSGDFTNAENLFLGGEALFYGADVKDIVNFKRKDLGFTFGYLPYPKWNSAQKDYLVSVNPYFSNMLIVPSTVSDSEFASFGLQALGERSPKITEQYVEVNCKIQGALDEAQYEMLNIVIKHPIYDIGVVFNWGNCYMGIFVDSYHAEFDGTTYEAIAVTGENNFATLWAVYESQVTKDYNDFIEIITN